MFLVTFYWGKGNVNRKFSNFKRAAVIAGPLALRLCQWVVVAYVGRDSGREIHAVIIRDKLRTNLKHSL